MSSSKSIAKPRNRGREWKFSPRSSKLMQQIQKVSAQLEVSRPAPQTVLNNK